MDSEQQDSGCLPLRLVTPPKPWTEAEDEQLKDLIFHQVNRKEIAKILKRGTASIGRRALRLGLCRTRAEAVRAQNTKVALTMAPVKHKINVPLPPIETPRPSPENCTLMELDSSKCHWPCNMLSTPTIFFCGKPTHINRPYCLEHCERSYVGFRSVAL